MGKNKYSWLPEDEIEDVLLEMTEKDLDRIDCFLKIAQQNVVKKLIDAIAALDKEIEKNTGGVPEKMKVLKKYRREVLRIARRFDAKAVMKYGY